MQLAARGRKEEDEAGNSDLVFEDGALDGCGGGGGLKCSGDRFEEWVTKVGRQVGWLVVNGSEVPARSMKSMRPACWYGGLELTSENVRASMYV